MSDETPADTGVVPVPEQNFRLQEAHGEIYLPELAPVAPDTPDFAVEVGRCLAPGIAETVAQMRQERRRGYRRYELIAILLLLAAAALFIYWYFPAPLPAVPFQFEWRFAGARYAPSGAAAAEYRAALEDFGKERYDAVVRRLEPVVREAVGRGEFRDRDELFYVFFTACGRSLGSGNGGAQTLLAWQWAETADLVADADPDQLQWRYLSVWLRRRILGGYESFYRDLQRGIYRLNWNLLDRQIQRALRQVETLRSRMADRRKLPQSAVQMGKQLDLLQAELLTFAWMVNGGRGGAEFPDDRGEAGVEYREDALALIRRHELDADARQFLELHRFLLETVMAQGGGYFNSLFWGGKQVYLLKPLQEELDMVKGRLANGKGAGL